MSKSKISSTGSAKQKAPQKVTVTYGDKLIGVNAEVYGVNFRSKQVKVLVYKNLTYDAYLAALPKTGLKAQGSKRILPIAKGDSDAAKMRVSDLAIAKLENRVETSSRGQSWDTYIENEVLKFEKVEYLRDEVTNKVKRDADGKAIKTGNKVAKYPIITAETEGLTKVQQRILNGVQKYFDNLDKRQSKIDAEKAENTQPKAEKASSKKKSEKAA